MMTPLFFLGRFGGAATLTILKRLPGIQWEKTESYMDPIKGILAPHVRRKGR